MFRICSIAPKGEVVDFRASLRWATEHARTLLSSGHDSVKIIDPAGQVLSASNWMADET